MVDLPSGGPNAAIFVVVAATVTGGVWMTEGPQRFVGLGLGVVYLVLATQGPGWVIRRGRRPEMYGLLGTLFALSLGIMVSFKGGGAYVTLPLTSMLLLYAPWRWALGQVAATAGLLAWLISLTYPEPATVAVGMLGYVSFAVFVGAFTRMALNEIRARAQAQAFAAQAVELATERERTRIARELHDSIGHALTALHVQLAAARALIATDTTAASSCLDQASTLAHEGLAEARRAVSMLRSEPLGGRPFAAALKELVCASPGAPTVSLEVSGTPRGLGAAIEFVIYRAVQEALTNVRRHARAKRADVRLHYGPSSITLEVEDDGAGAEGRGQGHGLLGLRERVETVGGAVAVTTAEGEGFRLAVEVPT